MTTQKNTALRVAKKAVKSYQKSGRKVRKVPLAKLEKPKTAPIPNLKKGDKPKLQPIPPAKWASRAKKANTIRAVVKLAKEYMGENKKKK